MNIFVALFVLFCCLTPASCIICGISGNATTYIPPNWDTFTAPEKGQSYVDPTFGCTITRLTNAATEETTWNGSYLSLMNYSSTFAAMNATDTWLFVYADDGSWRIKDMTAITVVGAVDMPIMNNGHPVWDAANGNVFYYAFNNSLYRAVASPSSVVSDVIHTFSEYSQGVVLPDGADLSQDGDHIALIGANDDNTMDVFVWSLTQQNKTSSYTTTCARSDPIIYSGQPGCVTNVQLTADNLLTMTFDADGSGPEQGMRFWNGSTAIALQDQRNHYETGYDPNNNSVFMGLNNSYTLPGITNSCGTGWGIDMRQIYDIQSQYWCIWDGEPDYHISFRGGPQQPSVALSFFDDRRPGPELFSSDPQYQAPSRANWKEWEDEIVISSLNNFPHGGQEGGRLAHARSRSAEGYWAQPRASISRDGRYVVFNSNMAFSAGCPPNMHVPGQCVDVYVIQIEQ